MALSVACMWAMQAERAAVQPVVFEAVPLKSGSGLFNFLAATAGASPPAPCPPSCDGAL